MELYVVYRPSGRNTAVTVGAVEADVFPAVKDMLDYGRSRAKL